LPDSSVKKENRPEFWGKKTKKNAEGPQQGRGKKKKTDKLGRKKKWQVWKRSEGGDEGIAPRSGPERRGNRLGCWPHGNQGELRRVRRGAKSRRGKKKEKQNSPRPPNHEKWGPRGRSVWRRRKMLFSKQSEEKLVSPTEGHWVSISGAKKGRGDQKRRQTQGRTTGKISPAALIIEHRRIWIFSN